MGEKYGLTAKHAWKHYNKGAFILWYLFCKAKHMIRILLITLLTVLISIQLAIASELRKISKVESKDIVQLFFTFDTPPRFASNADNKRIDLIFHDCTKAADLDLFEPDEHIVKVLSREIKGKVIITLYFRYQPQKFKLTPSAESNVVFEVLLGNEYSKSYQDLAERLKGLTVSDRTGVDFTNPYIISPYVKDWISFFVDYESPIYLTAPVAFTLPPFPLIALLPPGLDQNTTIFSDEINDLASQNLWELLSNKILEEIEGINDLEKQKLFALTYGEVLARAGDFEGAYKQLYLIKTTYEEELIGVYAHYFLILLRSIQEDPYLAEFEYRKLEDSINNKSPLAPYFFLSRIETALASRLLTRMNVLLQQDNIGLPPDVAHRVTIRQADYWYTINQPVKAYASYNLLQDSQLLPTQPYSFSGFSNTLYEQNKFRDAAMAYRTLASLVQDKESLGLVSYREKMSRLKFNTGGALIDDFAQIENAFPDTISSALAGIKKFDLLLLEDRKWAETAREGYKSIADRVSDRSVREEAYFKEILIHRILEENDIALKKVQQFLREFQTGNVRISAQALLIDILPAQIKKLVDSGEYVQALILAKQNKVLFEKSWLDSQFLIDIARAYHNVGIFDEAQKLYLYLIEIMPIDRREKFYLPMIQATFDYGNYSLVEDYAAQYIYNYPQGEFFNEVLYLRLQSLIADERLNDALAILPIPLVADTRFYRLAGVLHFRMDNYSKALESLISLEEVDTLSQIELFLLAECYFQTGNTLLAQEKYELIDDENPFYEQALFRLAQLARQANDQKKALIIFNKIVEEGKNSRWIQLAERELQFEKQKEIARP